MTQREFEERIGMMVTAEIYTKVEQCYMNTDLDKDLFCKLWKENPAALAEIESKTVLARELYEERKRLSNFLIEKAISMIGEKEYLRRKIAAGYNLWDADKELLGIILKN